MALYLGDTEVAPVIEVPVPETLYGATVDMVLGDEPVGDLSFDGVTEANQYQFAYKFSKTRNVIANREITIQFPDLDATSTACMDSMFFSAFGNFTENARVTFLFPKLTIIQGAEAFSSFTSTAVTSSPSVGSKITRLEFPLLSEVYGNRAFRDAFPGTTDSNTSCLLESVSFPSLETINGGNAFEMCFRNQKALKIVSFPALTTMSYNVFGTNSRYYAFSNCTAITEIHFRADAQAAIEAVTGYADKWGATNATIYFDL